MKKGIQLFLLILFSATLFAQQEEIYLKNDLGVNINAILNKAIFKKVNDEMTNPFPDQLSILTFRHFVSPKIALRLGFGFDHFSRIDSTSNPFSGVMIEDDKFNFYAIHFGFQKNIIDGEKVKFSIGWDWIFRRELQKRKRNDFFFGGGIGLDEIIRTDFYLEKNLGFGIPIGIQYFINDHIFISTEFSLEAMQQSSKTKSEFENSTDSDYEDNPDFINVNLRPPLALFVHYRF